MAITTVPQISGPSFGGVIYGLSLSIGYSQEPSKLILDIVNERGQYSTPSLNSRTSVSFAGFNFNGTIWSYNFKETAQEKTLQVTIIDNSIILDRYYVLLWKRGLLNVYGSPFTKTKTFDFSDESILVPKKFGTAFPLTRFEERRLGSASVSRTGTAIGSRTLGNVILVGEEKFRSSECDLPDTWYSFNNLRAVLPFNHNAPSNAVFKTTHEGTLRSVLASWGSDLGFDFYWDYSSDTLVCYDSTRGIVGNLPNSTASNIISKETSASLEGTFRQYGISYTSAPKEPIKTLTGSTSDAITYTVSPYKINTLARKNGNLQDLNAGGREKWGANRSTNEFILSGILGFVSRSLRDLYSFQQEHWDSLGYQIENAKTVPKNQMIIFLKKAGFEDMIADYEAFDAKDLPNYSFYFVNHDPTKADKWFEVEQEFLTYHGKYYRIPDNSGSFFYCSSTVTAEVQISVDPEGQVQEEDNNDFAGRKIYNRDGQMSHDQASALEALGYEKLTKDIQSCAPLHINIKEAGLFDQLVNSKLLGKSDVEKINTILLVPSSQKFVKAKIGFEANTGKSSHPLEVTWKQQRDAIVSNGRKNCAKFDELVKKGSCISAEEEARDKAITAAGGNRREENLDDLLGGLEAKQAYYGQVKLKTGNVKIFVPSDSSLRVVCKYDITVNKISTNTTPEFLWSEGDVGTANDVAEIRVVNENVTDPYEDVFQSKRKTRIPVASNVIANAPQQNIKYTFAGNPNGVSLSPRAGLSNLDVSLSSDGFKTTATFSTKAPKPAKANTLMREVSSQFNRYSFNSA